MKWKFFYLILLFLSTIPYLPLAFLPPQGIFWIRYSYLALPKVCFFIALICLLKGTQKPFLRWILPFLMFATFWPGILRLGVHHFIILLNTGRNIKEVQNYFPGTRMYINGRYTTFNWNLGNWDNYEELVCAPEHHMYKQEGKTEIIHVINQDWYVRSASIPAE